MTDQPHRQPAPSEHDQAPEALSKRVAQVQALGKEAADALAREAAAVIGPLLEERNGRLGELCEQLDTVTANLARACAGLDQLAEAAAAAKQPTHRDEPA